VASEDLRGVALKPTPTSLPSFSFGSSVYAPELALDLDLLVITQRKKDDGVLLERCLEFWATLLGGCCHR
jgi:hypothetical protein